MKNSNTAGVTPRYTRTAIVLHWLSALLWLVVWALGILCVYSGLHALVPLHKGLATLILLLAVIRVLWRFRHPSPALPTTFSRTERRLAQLGHFALYGFALLLLPLSGWLLSSFAHKPVMLAGLIPLPYLTGPHPEYVSAAYQLHRYLAWWSGALVLGHVVMALKHHVIDRDGLLWRMSPHAPRRTDDKM